MIKMSSGEKANFELITKDIENFKIDEKVMQLEETEILEVDQQDEDDACDVSSNTESPFYKDAQKYWAEVPATIDGMLGGFGFISSIDINGSDVFIKEMFALKKPLGKQYALDCGAGIGRVSKNFLMKYFDTVDMVEQDKKFSDAAREYCSSSEETKKKLGTVYNIGLQKFEPEPNKYDLIWSQWVLGHLTDEDLLSFFKRIKNGLSKSGGMFVMKENISSSGNVEVDETDSSVTRPLKRYEEIIKKAEMRIVKSSRQLTFPKGLFPVYMIACRPKKDKLSVKTEE